jgi:hypothetical protein
MNIQLWMALRHHIFIHRSGKGAPSLSVRQHEDASVGSGSPEGPIPVEPFTCSGLPEAAAAHGFSGRIDVEIPQRLITPAKGLCLSVPNHIDSPDEDI